MPQVKDINILTFDDKAYSVDDMSPEIKALVYHYNDANKKDAELSDRIVLLRAAKDALLSQIRAKYQAEQKEAMEKAAKEALDKANTKMPTQPTTSDKLPVAGETEK